MYVADVTSMEELQELLAEAEDRLALDPTNEQAAWDIEDIEDRMAEIA